MYPVTITNEFYTVYSDTIANELYIMYSSPSLKNFTQCTHSQAPKARPLNLTFNGNGHLGQFDQPFLPQFKGFLCSPVSISGTAAKQLSGAVVKVAAE